MPRLLSEASTIAPTRVPRIQSLVLTRPPVVENSEIVPYSDCASYTSFAESQIDGRITPIATVTVIITAQVVRRGITRFSMMSAGWNRNASSIAHAIGTRNGYSTA